MTDPEDAPRFCEGCGDPIETGTDCVDCQERMEYEDRADMRGDR